jgi:hypothetical protein
MNYCSASAGIMKGVTSDGRGSGGRPVHNSILCDICRCMVETLCGTILYSAMQHSAVLYSTLQFNGEE